MLGITEVGEQEVGAAARGLAVIIPPGYFVPRRHHEYQTGLRNRRGVLPLARAPLPVIGGTQKTVGLGRHLQVALQVAAELPLKPRAVNPLAGCGPGEAKQKHRAQGRQTGLPNPPPARLETDA